MNSSDIRQSFLDFFAKQGHQVVPSSPLIPAQDPSLLFTNAGMVQFKDVFLGREVKDYTRAVSAQRCLRAGGKHNDLENVGYTARHHTLFEMMGNFSFGDYFKREAIDFAWRYLTEELKLPIEKLWVTVHHSDDEAEAIWLNEMGVSDKRFSRLGDKDNFWAMGDTGPCGPCTEIFYDHGEHIEGAPPGFDGDDGDRYVEIWNLVFMQYVREQDGSQNALPKPSVDTGMGLERVAAVMQGVNSNYDTDLFVPLIANAAASVGIKDLKENGLKVIADHIRASAFLITDGVRPSNEGRGYVLRRIIRRAIRHGYQLGQEKPFFHQLVPTVVDTMGVAYPELVKAKNTIEKVLLQEGERFAETITHGMGYLANVLSTLSTKVIPGNDVFKLYDTYGFPIDLTADVARERGLTIDESGFEQAMQKQRKQSQAGSQFATKQSNALEKLLAATNTEFLGYEAHEATAKVTHLFDIDDNPVKKLVSGQSGVVILDRTPFYAESGGQVADSGVIKSASAHFSVRDVQKMGGAFAHFGEVTQGELDVTSVEASIDAARRLAIIRHHSATHLMHAALRNVLGDHVVQKGSLVDDKRTRFDFAHAEPLTHEEISSIEQQVNAMIMANDAADIKLLPYQEAIDSGAMALFGEKYGDKVRVLAFGQASVELCGGTHVARTGDIGFFKIISESGVAAGVRRVEAVSGEVARQWVDQRNQCLQTIASVMRAPVDDLPLRVETLLERERKLEKENKALQSKLAGAATVDWQAKAADVEGIKVIAERMDDQDIQTLRDASDQIRNKLGSSIVVLGGVEEGKVRLVASVSKDASKQYKAGDLVKDIAVIVDGKGGGRPDFAQAGGQSPEKLGEALAAVLPWVEARAAR